MRNKKKIAALIALLLLSIVSAYGPTFYGGGPNLPKTPTNLPVVDNTNNIATLDVVPQGGGTQNNTYVSDNGAQNNTDISTADVQNSTDPSTTDVQDTDGENCSPGLSPGYWKHNVNVYSGGDGSYSGDPRMTAVQLETYETYIKAHFKSTFSLEWAQERFQDPQYNDEWLTIANWFNAAADRLPYTDS